MITMEDLSGWTWIENYYRPRPCLQEAGTYPEIQEEIREEYIPERGGTRINDN